MKASLVVRKRENAYYGKKSVVVKWIFEGDWCIFVNLVTGENE